MRAIAFVLAALLAAPCAAQIFPKTDKDNVAEEIDRSKRTGNDPKPDEPKPDNPPPTPRNIDGAAALARFKEHRENFHKLSKEKEEIAESKKVTGQFHDVIAEYHTAMAALKLGYYKEAARLFKGIEKPDEEDVKKLSGESQELARRIQKGRHFYYRAIAEAMQHYAFVEKESDSDFEKRWTKAKAAAAKVIDDLRAKGPKQIDQLAAGILERMINSWLDAEKAEWLSLRAAEKYLHDNPGEFGAWQKYVSLVAHNSRDELTPSYIDGRAAIFVIKEFMVDPATAKRGAIDVGLAWSYTAVLQFDRANAALEAAENLDGDGKKFVDNQKREIQRVQEAVLREYRK